jgi:hypothetical protein
MRNLMTLRLAGSRLRGRPAARILLLMPALLLAGWWVAAQLRPPRLRHGAPSPEELARRVLDGLQTGDLRALESLALSADEFRDFVWPELPVSNPRTNVPLDYVWGDVHLRSTARLQAMLRALKGEGFSLVRVRHTGPRTDYPTHRAYSDFEIVLRDRDGKEREYPLFGTLIEMDGVWKVYSYAPYD